METIEVGCGCRMDINEYDDALLTHCPKHAAVDRLIEALEEMLFNHYSPDALNEAVAQEARALLDELKPTK